MSYSWTSAQKNADDEIQQLLQQLRESQDILPPPGHSPTPPASSSFPPPVQGEPPPPTKEQLDALLFSLQSTPHSPDHPLLPALPQKERDLAQLSFPESLPKLQALSLDPDFLDALGDLKREQDDQELRLRDERNRMADELKRGSMPEHKQKQSLKEWDRKALLEWKKLKRAQQVRLKEMQVPTFCPTSDATVLKRQERVMAVLVGFLDD